MKSFILLTFGFLAFAFYEMSGGADFEPASARVAETQPARIDTAEPTVVAAADQVESQEIADEPASEVSRAAINLTSVAKIEPKAETPSNITRVKFSEAQSIGGSDIPQIVLPSLILQDDSPVTAEPVAQQQDTTLRAVSGNRVNVRGGPSTNFGVVGKLVRGDQVRILEDNGNGWVLMQHVDSNTEGWMAEFLLTSG
ncbi:SH3 domain-containing protein [Sulfitobacter sp. S190]|uniref:SH3 domain-containing protein n=1 Tax=Sulfitobacter sp. S190 TaxID=2867022 RepID=UPI0021A72B94|nr:SH3 domain-containing protein [Sulfitobacter sp. S190]UWR22930.1 SH3 domain-containing protein [Sulfitobacter sp. S190]